MMNHIRVMIWKNGFIVAKI